MPSKICLTRGFETFGAAIAENYRIDIITCFELLAVNPRLGRRADNVGSGRRRHKHGRHVIFHDEQPDGVLILDIINERSIRSIPPHPS